MPATPVRPPAPTNPDENRPDDEQKTFDLSLTQIVGGALAAMTAAYLGSRLSVAGTVIGAAVASIVAGIAGSVYTASIRHTRDKVRSVWTGRTSSVPTEVAVTRGSGSAGQDRGVTAASTAPVEWQLPADTGSAVAATPPSGAPEPPLWRTGRFWKRMAIGAVATFALAVGAITGLELVSGQALSGGEGTTVTRVREGQPDRTTDKPSQSPSDEPSESPSDGPSESPSDGPSEQPNDAPSSDPGDQPSTEPTQEPSAEQSSAPSSSEPNQPDEPTAPAGGDQGGADSGAGTGAGTGSGAGAGNRAPGTEADPNSAG